MPTRKIETEISLGGEKQFNDAMKNCNSNLKTLRTDMAAVSSEFRKNENSIQALTAKQKILREQYAQQQAVVEALRTRLQSVAKTYGEDSAQADKLRQQLNAATIKLKDMKEALDQNAEALSKHGPIIGRVNDLFDSLKDKLDDALKSVDSSIKRVPVLGDVYEAAGKSASAMASTTGKAFNVIGKAAGGLAATGGVVVGTVSAIGVAALDTLTGFATDAATRAKNDYDRANELAELANQAFLKGNEEAGMEYLRQANELIDGIDQDYLQLGFSLDRLSSASTSARDAMGKILLPALKGLSDEGTELLSSFARDMEAAAGDTEQMGQIIAQYVLEAADLIREQIPVFGQIAVDLIKGLAGGLGDEENLALLLDDLLGVVTYIVDTIADYAPQIGTAASALISTLLSFLLENAPTLLDAGVEVVSQLITGMASSVPDLLTKTAALVTTMLSKLVEKAPDMVAGGLKLIAEIIAGLAQALPDILAAMIALPGQLIKAFQEADVDWKALGMNIITGIWDGIKEMWNELVEWVEGAFSRLGNRIKRLLGISSPSKWYRDQIGVNMALGVGEGFENGMERVSDQMQRSLDEAAPDSNIIPFNRSLDAPAVSGGSVTSFGGVTLIVNGYNVQDDEALAERLSYELQKISDQRGA